MLILSSAFAAIIPMAAYLILIWRFDRYDREPIKLVLTSYFWGAVGAILFSLIGSFIFSALLSFLASSEQQLNHLGTIVVAPVVEEITKGIFLFVIIANRKFDNLTDGIVYGGAIGLGFGMTENFLYFISYGTTISDWIAIVIIRTLFSAVMHCVATAIFGAFLGHAKFKGKNKFLLSLAGLAIAIFIHFAWNFSVSFQSTAALGFLFLFATVIIFIAAFSASVLQEKRIIYEELLPETQMGIIPANHLNILCSPARNFPGWVDENIRKVYVRSATTLAFRKIQMRYSKGKSRDFYENDVVNYREFIRNLLSSHGNTDG